MPNTFTITTDDADLHAKLLAVVNGGAAPAAAMTAASPALAAPTTTAPAPMAAPAAPVPPAAPAAAPAPAAPAVAHGPAPAGWTQEHIVSALGALGANAAKGGPAAVQKLLQEYGATSVSGLNPAQWPEIYAKATA